MSFAEEFPGATQPFGFFDPLGLSKVIPLPFDDFIGDNVFLPTD